MLYTNPLYLWYNINNATQNIANPSDLCSSCLHSILQNAIDKLLDKHGGIQVVVSAKMAQLLQYQTFKYQRPVYFLEYDKFLRRKLTESKLNTTHALLFFIDFDLFVHGIPQWNLLSMKNLQGVCKVHIPRLIAKLPRQEKLEVRLNFHTFKPQEASEILFTSTHKQHEWCPQRVQETSYRIKQFYFERLTSNNTRQLMQSAILMR